MAYKGHGRHHWQIFAAATALATAFGIATGFLAPAMLPALAAVTTTTAPTTTAPVIGSNCSASTSGTALDRTGWVASSNAPSNSAQAPSNALDGNEATRFSTDEDQAYGLYVEVDLGSANTFDEVAMTVPDSPTEYARDYHVDVSANGSSWTTVASCTGTGTQELVSFPTQTAQYLKIVLIAASTTWWSIDELNLYGDGSNCFAATSGTALGRTGWVPTTNAPSTSTDAPANALDDNLTTRFSTDEDQAYGLYLQVDLGSARAFDELAMSVPNSPTEYARAYHVDVSANGSSWTIVANCTGDSTSEIVSFPTQTVRYVKVFLITAATSWWSIDELNLYGDASTTTTSLSSSANPATVGRASLYYTAKVVPVPSGGTVNFFGDGAPILGCTKVDVSTTTGEATCTASYLSTGHFGVQAFYSGSGAFGPSVSALYEEVVILPAPGYWLATSNGQVYSSGAAPSLGSIATSATTGPLVGIAGTLSGQGYWVVTANGTVSGFGDAKFYGDMPDLGKHVSDIVAIAPTSDGQGYYLVGADGGFFTFGDARFHGSLPGIHLHVRDVVGMVASPSGAGYLLVGADGGVFTFGNSRFYGSLPGIGKHVHDLRAILPSSTGRGYILVGSDGGAFIFGTGVKFLGSLPGEGIKVADVVGIALTPDNGGYYMAGADGHVYGFGEAQVGAEPSGVTSNLPVAAIAGT